MPTENKDQVLKAINDLGRRVTVADVAAKTGLPLNVATRELNTIASETQGHLEVATTGDIAYSFSPGFQNTYLAQGFKRALNEFGQAVYKAAFFLLKISFGLGLILSLVLVVLIFLVIMLRAGGGRDDNNIDIDFNFFDFMILRDLLEWGTYATISGPYGGYRDPYGRDRQRNNNFLFNCFSFLFGDGNPNFDFDERKWQLIAQVIRNHDGVLTSDQLAPYTGADPKDEDAVLPVLVRFDGRPEVSDTGNIIYVFPTMQVSTAGAFVSGLPAFMRELEWQFSNAPTEALVPIFILAIVNFLGSWWLFLHMSGLVLLGLAPLLLFLVAYGTFFVGLPLARFLAIQVFNGKIRQRNDSRQGFARRLQSPEDDLRTKLSEARQFQIEDHTIGAGDIVYTTEKDALDQEDALDEEFKKPEFKHQLLQSQGLQDQESDDQGFDDQGFENRTIKEKQRDKQEFEP